MVLADSHTISKSIDNDYKVDDNRFETIHDIDRPINAKTRRDRQHNCKQYYSKDENVTQPANLKATKPHTDLDRGIEQAIVKTTLKLTTAKHHKSPKRRVGSFWRKLRGKDKKSDTNKHGANDRKRRICNHKKDKQNAGHLTTKNSRSLAPRTEAGTRSRRKNGKKISLRQHKHEVTKRDVNGLFSTRPYSNTAQSFKLQMGIAPQVDNMLKSKMKAVHPHTAVGEAPPRLNENLERQLESITIKISALKDKYGLGGSKLSNTLMSTRHSAKIKTPTATTTQAPIVTFESDFKGTIQIEEMLNDIKSRSMDIVSYQKPFVTNLISSSVAEASFNSSPIFRSISMPASTKSLNTFGLTNDVKDIEQGTFTSTEPNEFNLNNLIFSANTESHYLAVRSIKEDTMTIAQNVEDMLQKELKNIYNKVKHKVSSDLRKEVHTAKTTAKEGYCKLSSKLSSRCKSKETSPTAPCTSTSPPPPKLCPSKSTTMKKKGKSTSTTTAARVKKKNDKELESLADLEDTFTPESVAKQTYDDYMMLTLFEQMLAKTHQENVRKMLAASEFPVNAKAKRETVRLSKRNPETLTDVKLREVVQNLYDDGGNMPDYDYIDPSANVTASGKPSASNSYNDVDYVRDSTDTTNNAQGSVGEPQVNIKSKETPQEHTEAEDSASDTSFEGLSNKISYNEFVNGYRHYLKFQKEQNNQNFSNMVKYQAHRHHNVDDIGKFILNKIPPLPSSKKKREQRFSDDSYNNMDYQEITTKNADSWFRKHFYLFIDNGPPKKYHTSETVELKPSSTEPKLYVTELTNKREHDNQILISIGADGVARKAKNTEDICLDDLSKILDTIKEKQEENELLSKDKPTQKDTLMPIGNYNATNDVLMPEKSLIGKLFSINRRHAPKKVPITTSYFPMPYDKMFDVSTKAREREKRLVTKENIVNIAMADFVNKHFEDKYSTGTKETFNNAAPMNNEEKNKYGYVDIDLVPRQTAVVRLRDNAKKNRFKSFFNKFHFKKKNSTKNLKPKRSCYYNFHTQNSRKERFNPFKSLKSMFKNKDEKETQDVTLGRYDIPNYDAVNTHDAYKPIGFDKKLNAAEMQKQIPNISDIYYVPESLKHSTKMSSDTFRLDDTDQDLLYNYHAPSSSVKQSAASRTETAAQIKLMITNATTSSPAVTRNLMESATKKPEIQIPPTNVITVNVKTMAPLSPTLMVTGSSAPMTIDDMKLFLDNIQNSLQKNSVGLPTTSFPSYVRQTGKYDYEKKLQSPLESKRPLEELIIKSKLSRIAKFPLKNRHYKIRRQDNLDSIDDDYLGFDRPSVMDFIHNLGSRNAPSERKTSVKGNALRKSHHPHSYKANDKDKSVYTDYFNDLLMWHNDILNLESVPNPLWRKILKTLQTDPGNSNTTPNMKELLNELIEMNESLDPGGQLNITEALTMLDNGSLSKDHVGIRDLEKNIDEQGVIRSIAMDDNTLVTSKDMIIKGEAKYYQYNKPKLVLVKPKDFITKLNSLIVNDADKDKRIEGVQYRIKGGRRFSPFLSDNYSEPAILVDTTLLAYDDDVESVTKALAFKKLSRNSLKSNMDATKNKIDHSTFLKTNEPPIQYYTTPLPMESQDFNQFLKERKLDVDSVTSPMLELPTIRTVPPLLKKKHWPKYNSMVATPPNIQTKASNWKTESTTTMQPYTVTTEPTTAIKEKPSTKVKEYTKQVQAKLLSFTKAMGKSLTFTKKQLQAKAKSSKSSVPNAKRSYLDNDDFDRYKRYTKLPTATAKPLKTTQDDNYYSIIKKKMKDKLFDKKANILKDHASTESFNVNPHDKEVEITIINFDDIEKMSKHQDFDKITTPTAVKDEIGAFIGVIDVTGEDNTDVTKQADLHNELLYKSKEKERTSTTSSRKEYSNIDLARNTEYVDPAVNDGLPVTTDELRHPFAKMYSKVFSKMPKNMANAPKRIRISSHHYHYDVLYDDSKKTRKTDGLRLKKHNAVTLSGMRRMKIKHKSSPTIFSKGTESGADETNDRTSHMNRRKRRLWGTDALHKKRKHFTHRGCKPKADGGLTEPIGYFETPTLDATEVSGTPLEGPLTSAVDMTTEVFEVMHEEPLLPTLKAEVSLKQHTEPMPDIEDVVTMLDKLNMGVTTSDIDDAVALSAIQSEFFTSITIKDTVRRAASTQPATTAAPTTYPTTKAVTKGTTTMAPPPQPGSLVYNLKHLKPPQATTKSRKDKEKHLLDSKTDRHRRLFKNYARLQNKFKSLMKNLTATTKHANGTSHAPVTSKGERCKTKRTCICVTYPDSPGSRDEVDDATEGIDTNKGMAMGALSPNPNERFWITLCPDMDNVEIETPFAPTTVKHPQSNLPPCEDQFAELNSPIPHHHTAHHDEGCASKNKVVPSKHMLYVEPETYNEQFYYEAEPMLEPPTTHPCRQDKSAKHSGIKREAQLNTFTAKDVAALEVIVDLMKNTLSYEDNSIANVFHHSNLILQPCSTKPTHSNSSTNSIQVHIAIPFDFQNGKKRSPSVPGPVRVRKVFSAKMSTPVDLEYQVHSFEGSIAPTSTKPSNGTDNGLTPGMYLLIDKPKEGLALKPVLGQLNLSDLKARQVAAGTTVSIMESKPIDTREETTSLKSLAKVTLSKDFIAAVNQHLIEMYENMSRVNKDVSNNVRTARSVWQSRKLKENKEGSKRNAERYIVKRRIDWEAVKKFFGHDRVCNCKCKSNKAMCSACAASDAVIDELIFEFDNIGRYMADHCTEIQTFFWMNPVGGQKLRDSVDKIDKSLSDYYKRVKGKCQGRLCKTFSSYVDKRCVTKSTKIKKENVISHLTYDLATLAEDLNRTVSLKACYNNKLKESGDKFVQLMNDCIMNKSFNKRSNPNANPKKLVKHVYSLDNINVNIICNPESASSPDEQMVTAAITMQDNPSQFNEHLLDLDLEETKHEKRKGFRKLFPRKNKKSKLFSYFELNKMPKTNYKRQVDNQVATSLISDGGGAFWYDYLKAGTNEPRFVRDSIKNIPKIEVTVIQKEETKRDVLELKESPSNSGLSTSTVHMAVKTTPERDQRDVEATTDSISSNINQLLQLFGSLQDVEAMNTNSNQPTTFLSNVTVLNKASLEEKPIKSTFTDVNKVKMEKASPNGKATSVSTSQKINEEYNLGLDKKLDELTTLEKSIESIAQNSPSTSTTERMLDKNIIIITTAGLANSFAYIPTSKTTSTTAKSSVATVSVKASERATTLASKSDQNLVSTPTATNLSTPQSRFINKLKSATINFFTTKSTSLTPVITTVTRNTARVSTAVSPSIIDLTTYGYNKELDYVIEESSQSTTQNPTIVIINEYGSQLSSDAMSDISKEGYRNLLLSIIQFETNNLNDEWERIAYHGDKHRDEADMKRSIVNAPKIDTDKPPIKQSPKPQPSDEKSGDIDLATTTEEHEGLLNKIASKIGIKVVPNKKKVVKKPTVREVKGNGRRVNFIKNRKLRINSYRQENPTTPEPKAEACHTRRTTQPGQICDIQATYDHIKYLQTSLPTKIFENIVRNISCYKYSNVGSTFVIPYKTKGKRWDWVRNKRSLKLQFYSRSNDELDLDEEDNVVNIEDDSNDSFERFVKGDDGIYKIANRMKRTADLETLERGLKNIPTLTPGENELLVMAGDSVTLDCGRNTPVRTCDGKFHWKTDRKRMLMQDNVYVDGVSVTVHNVEPRNFGTYTCCLDHTVRRNVRLNVLTVPTFEVVFLPVYKTRENCSYDDLRAIQRLGCLMADETHCGKACSIRIDEPVCQKDKGTNSNLIRATAVITMTPRDLNCSLQCKRDIISSLVMLCATNTAVLSSVRVLVSKDGVNKTLMPWKNFVRPVVTHSLRKKDSNGHHEYHKLASLLSPGKVDVVLLCPAGYYLLPRYKLCSSCPPNTSSRAGDNSCHSCPRGTRAEPGSAKCSVVKTIHRRYDWWWYPPCGYLVACCGALLGCTACVLLSVIVHVVSRDADLQEHGDEDDEEQETLKKLTRITVAYAHVPSTRPLSPSRVILPRFFRPSLTSSRATDSQETKFELWKERNRPPPLPPIDFDP